MMLRSLRMKSGLTQRGVAEKLGYSSPQFVSNWERGRAQLPISKFKSAARLFSVPVSVLIDAHCKTNKEKLYKRLGVK